MNPYGYPPPPPQRGNGTAVVAWLALALASISFLAVALWFGSIFLGFMMWDVDDGYPYTESDYGYAVDDEEIDEAVEGACEDLRLADELLGPFSSATDAAPVYASIADAGREIVEAVDATGTSDEDALAWRDDWHALVPRIDSFARDLATGNGAARLDPPLDDGESVLWRMDGGSPVGCESPSALHRAVGTDPYDYY